MYDSKTDNVLRKDQSLPHTASFFYENDGAYYQCQLLILALHRSINFKIYILSSVKENIHFVVCEGEHRLKLVHLVTK